MRKNLIAAIVFYMVFVCLTGYFFPIKKVMLHDRTSYVVISRIYPNKQNGDVVLKKDGSVGIYEEGKKKQTCIGRILISTTEGLL